MNCTNIIKTNNKNRYLTNEKLTNLTNTLRRLEK